MMADVDYTPLIEAVKRSKYLTALTGAGVSTLSGIPDFRGGNGVYTKPWHGMAVETILSIECFREHPEYFYEWACDFVYCAGNFAPSAVHIALAGLEKQGLLKALYTQNIDILHTKAGSRAVYELHGSAARHHCTRCHAEYAYEKVAPVVLSGRVPHCEDCGGVIKPDIVFYGEALVGAMLNQAELDMARTDLMLVLGTSLTVYPAAALPEQAASYGAKLVIVNAQPTGLDSQSMLHYDDLGETAQALIDAFGIE
ncbi:MAG: NAD-dependent protein deacylase [Victivallaceae bacterium]|nr:NAD-dependent protein deacylase [Victivallaceae bacterium]